MSHSGVPVVSDAAKTFYNIGSSIGDIAAGKNVFESVGRIAASPLSFAGGTLNSVTGGYIDKVPIVGGVAKSSADFQNDPYSRSNALALGRSSAIAGASVAGAIVGGPLISARLGIGGTAGSVLAGDVTSKLASGDYSGAANLASGAVGNYISQSDIGQAISPYSDSIKSAISTASKSGGTPINNVSPAAQVLNTSTGFSGTAILMVGLIGFGAFLLVKKKVF